MEMMAESRTKKEKNSMNSPLIILDSPNNSPWKKLLNVFRDQGCCRPKKEKRTLDDDENSIESDSLCVSSSDFSSSDSSSSVPGDIVVNLDADRLVMECTSDLIESQSSHTEDSTSSSGEFYSLLISKRFLKKCDDDCPIELFQRISCS